MRINKKINLITKENDIKYRAPLSYRHLRIIGWIMMAMAQAAVVCAACVSFWADTSHNLVLISNVGDVLGFFGDLVIPLFLLANFSLILNSKEHIKRLIITHASLAVLIYLIFLLLYERYLCGIVAKLSPTEGKQILDAVVFAFFGKNLCFNVFIDLLMCSLFYFFICYKPEKVFVDNKLKWFRLMAILPVAYEISSIFIKGFGVAENLYGGVETVAYFTIPVEVIPLLSSKPVLTFAAFIAITIFIKRRESLYLKRGGTKAQYEEFLNTNTNSLHFSIFVAITFSIAAILDFIASTILSAGYLARYPDIDITTKAGFKLVSAYCNGWEIGGAVPLIIAAPIVILFDYKKMHKKESKYLDMLIPLIGLCLCLLVYIEGFYEIIAFK